jgi:hypothetical protein
MQFALGGRKEGIVQSHNEELVRIVTLLQHAQPCGSVEKRKKTTWPMYEKKCYVMACPNGAGKTILADEFFPINAPPYQGDKTNQKDEWQKNIINIHY